MSPLYLESSKRLGIKASGKRIAAKPIIQKILVDKMASSMTAIGLIIAVNPKTEAILKILDPIRFPREIAFSFLRAAKRCRFYFI